MTTKSYSYHTIVFRFVVKYDLSCLFDQMFRGKTAESGVITASLKIPVPSSATVIDDSVIDDIPFIEDSERHQLTLGKSDLTSLLLT